MIFYAKNTRDTLQLKGIIHKNRQARIVDLDLQKLDFTRQQRSQNTKLAIRVELIAQRYTPLSYLPTGTITAEEILTQFGNPFQTAILHDGTNVPIKISEIRRMNQIGSNSKYWVYFTIDHIGDFHYFNIPIQISEQLE